MTRRSPEKAEERQADELMTLLGFRVIRFSQARATMQTPGIPDRLYLRGARKPGEGPGLAVWYEAKDPDKGRQTDAQRGFQADIEALTQPGHVYILGPFAALLDWCVARGLCTSSASRFGPLYHVDKSPDPKPLPPR